MTVPPQHPRLDGRWRVRLHTDPAEVPVPASRPLSRSRIAQIAGTEGVTCCHPLEGLLPEDLATESFHPGETARGALDAPVGSEVLVRFRDLAAGAQGRLARPILKRHGVCVPERLALREERRARPRA